MFDLHELSTEEESPAPKPNIGEIINRLKGKDAGHIEEKSDDDVTIVLSEDDSSVECTSQKKEKLPSPSKRDRRTSRTSTTSNKSTVKTAAAKQGNEEVKLDNSSAVKTVGRRHKVFAPNVNPLTTRSLRKQPQSASLSLPEGNKIVASSSSSLNEKKLPTTEEKPGEESKVEKRGRRAVQPLISKLTKQQSESDDEEEEPAKNLKEMTGKMKSVVVLLERLSPLMLSQFGVSGKMKSSLSEEKKASSILKSPISDKAVTSKMKENELLEGEEILSLDENAFTLRRSATFPNKMSANERPRISEIITTHSDSDDSVFLEDDPVKKTLAFPSQSKPEVLSKSSDDDEEEATASKPANEELLDEATDVEFIVTNSSNENSSPVGISSKRRRGRPLKKPRGQPLKYPKASKSAIPSDPLLLADEMDQKKKALTRPMVKKRPVESEKLDVTPQKKKRLSEETTVVESDSEPEEIDKGEKANDIQKEVFTVLRRGLRLQDKAAISPDPQFPLAKSSDVSVATRSTRKTPSTTLETRVKDCRVLLERVPEIEAMCMKKTKSTEKVAAAKPEDNSPAKRVTKVTRGTMKVAKNSEADVEITPLFPPRKLRTRQI